MRPVILVLIGLALGGFFRPAHIASAQAPVPSGTVLTIAGSGSFGFSGLKARIDQKLGPWMFEAITRSDLTPILGLGHVRRATSRRRLYHVLTAALIGSGLTPSLVCCETRLSGVGRRSFASVSGLGLSMRLCNPHNLPERKL